MARIFNISIRIANSGDIPCKERTTGKEGIFGVIIAGIFGGRKRRIS